MDRRLSKSASLSYEILMIGYNGHVSLLCPIHVLISVIQVTEAKTYQICDEKDMVKKNS